MSWRFARSWALAEWAEIRRGHWNRPATWVTLLGTLELVILGGAAITLLSTPTAGLITAAITLLAAPALVTATQLALVAHEHATALRAWFLETSTMRAGATITQRRGSWWLHNVHTTPTGHGHGTHLMRQICAAADQAQQDLHLKSSGPEATRFYQRHGFTTINRRHMHRTPTTSPPKMSEQ